MNKNQRGNSVLAAMFFMVIVIAILGWIMNIATIFQTVDATITGMFILRCIGIFVAPLGAVLGYV